MSKTRCVTIILSLCLLWAAFSCVGLLMHRACEDAPKNHLHWTDVAGYDSEGYVSHFASPIGLFEVHSRHPWMGAATFPITVVGLMAIGHVEPKTAHKVVFCCFALVGALTCWMLWLVMKKSGAEQAPRIAAILLWLSFAHVWILGGIAESFNVSQAIMLGVLLMVLYNVRDIKAWLAVSALAGCVTITNVVKPIVAWLVAAGGMDFMRKLRRKTIVVLVGCAFAALILAIVAMIVKWIFFSGLSIAQGIEINTKDIASCIPDGSISHRLWLVWNAFWCEPMMLRESVIAKGPILRPYDSFLPHLAGIGVLGLCIWSALRNFHLPIVRAALAMVVFDVFLHTVIGWGLVEGQIYCGHWFWIIPLLISLLPKKSAFVIVGLAIAIAFVNLTTVIPAWLSST